MPFDPINTLNIMKPKQTMIKFPVFFSLRILLLSQTYCESLFEIG